MLFESKTISNKPRNLLACTQQMRPQGTGKKAICSLGTA